MTKEMERDNETFKDEIKAMSAELAKAQGDVSQYTERQTKASARKVELEGQLAEAQNLLKAEEASRLELAAEVKAHSGSVNVVKKEIQDLELAIQKVETEKANRDHAISALNDEIQSQDEVINKLNKEKKHLADNQAKSSDDLQGAEEKVSHLNSVKSKLESTLDELESSLEREKRSRATVEKERRKLQGELKLAQDQVTELHISNFLTTLIMIPTVIINILIRLPSSTARRRTLRASSSRRTATSPPSPPSWRTSRTSSARARRA